MSQTSIELQVPRDTSRKQVTEDYVGPIAPIANGRDTDNAERPVQTKKQALDAKIQFTACCVSLFLAGWNDGTLGPLLPRIQSVYHVGFAVVSLLFVLACLGFIAGALINVPLSDKLGFGKVIVIGSLFQVVAYSIMAPALPFPALVIAYFINGIGIAMQDAQANGYVAALESNAEAKMGLLHAVYGAGALCSPLVATQFAQLRHWSFQYLVSLGLSIANTVTLIAVFRFRTQDECLQKIGQPVPERTSSSNDHSTFRQILNQKTVHLLAFYILVYVGVEVTIGGWIVTFIIRERNGGPSSGYISAGFFGGLMTGRVALLWVNEKIGERLAIFVYAFLAIGLELIVWLVPSLIGDAVAVSIVGVLLGPMYPIAMNHAGRVLPRWILTGSIGWIAGFGQAGSAVLPFMTGAISSKFGIRSLQPLLVSMMGLMIIMWAIVPKGPRRAD
ncbi:putative related to tetracycline resistance proteins [Lyophyllum shimeji]|uniref:Related to tetracycline resistance proteins n=1 Tax=Lyophyllum shimeji TaxID=47721 RepID=A0A9P3UWL1_LYOSH|nr:putative related to tetracycline resistance proteins [Lyophyllum shimeji]